MNHEANVLKALPFDNIDDVRDVGIQINVFAQEMRALAQPGERRRKNLMTFLFQMVRNPAPRPAPAKGAVDEHERLSRGLSARRANKVSGDSSRGETNAGCNAGNRAAAGDVRVTHVVCPSSGCGLGFPKCPRQGRSAAPTEATSLTREWEGAPVGHRADCSGGERDRSVGPHVDRG